MLLGIRTKSRPALCAPGRLRQLVHNVKLHKDLSTGNLNTGSSRSLRSNTGTADRSDAKETGDDGDENDADSDSSDDSLFRVHKTDDTGEQSKTANNAEPLSTESVGENDGQLSVDSVSLSSLPAATVGESVGTPVTGETEMQNVDELLTSVAAGHEDVDGKMAEELKRASSVRIRRQRTLLDRTAHSAKRTAVLHHPLSTSPDASDSDISD